ncbi:IS4 family transposase [Ruminococcus sp. OA3]|uniref:IS4 family transposase n=1 Tax=Ruminococcus sp. OA3 TaxID=2914164 RepID=UPI001F06AF54|nr:IS4 family transposase [Ruminococcus sp. OA3]MCH1982518.1 IS4 family transposase [Ruminococcus sp. OA3]MCH1983069.1 IS4 family transposase [Ruminococcus sp. OA3]
MSDFIESTTKSLETLISELATNPSLFLRNPSVDFTRNRKIDFKTLVGITMNSGGCTMNKELLDFFDFDVNTPTVSAYTQQRSKVLPEAFEFLFQEFNVQNQRIQNLYEGYQLLACDGCNLSIATNPKDSETAWKQNQYGGITNHLHLNAFYDIQNRVYTDAIVQTASEYQEHRACIQMMERSHQSNVILVADRGYENYNIMAHAINKGWNFLIRIKDIGSNGMASGLELPDKETFDLDVDIKLTRKQTKAKRMEGYKFMPTCQTFDYLPVGSPNEYTLSFRIARFKISEDSFEMVVTNLNEFEFSPKKLKEIYQLRWGIETSFRELKYAIGLTNFHAKKVDYIKQEIFARLTLYNYCELITAYVIKQSNKFHQTKQVNFTIAIYICREYLRRKRQLSSPAVIRLIEQHTLPVRPGRRDPRKVKPQASVSFLYRVA